MIARSLGRTRAELLSSISARELVWQKALHAVEAEEREASRQDQARAMRRRK